MHSCLWVRIKAGWRWYGHGRPHHHLIMSAQTAEIVLLFFCHADLKFSRCPKLSPDLFGQLGRNLFSNYFLLQETKRALDQKGINFKSKVAFTCLFFPLTPQFFPSHTMQTKPNCRGFKGEMEPLGRSLWSADNGKLSRHFLLMESASSPFHDQDPWVALSKGASRILIIPGHPWTRLGPRSLYQGVRIVSKRGYSNFHFSIPASQPTDVCWCLQKQLNIDKPPDSRATADKQLPLCYILAEERKMFFFSAVELERTTGPYCPLTRSYWSFASENRRACKTNTASQ
jgi:hypothetical protein